MTVTSAWFGLALAHSWGGVTAGETQYFIDYLSDTIKVSLHTSSYTPNQDTAEFWSACTNEVSNNGYTTGGATLGTKTLTYTAGTNVLMFDAADPTWTAGAAWSSYPRIAVIYKVGGTAATSPVMGYIDFGANVTTIASTNIFTIIFATAGIFTITPATPA
jgi:hypothetical protein